MMSDDFLTRLPTDVDCFESSKFCMELVVSKSRIASNFEDQQEANDPNSKTYVFTIGL